MSIKFSIFYFSMTSQNIHFVFSITLIIVSKNDNSSDVYLSRLLDYIFQCMVLVYGWEDLTNIKNIERFKKEIKVCCPKFTSLKSCLTLEF